MSKKKKMTCRELLAIERPDLINDDYDGGCWGCPCNYGYLNKNVVYENCIKPDDKACTKCWDQPADEEAVKRVMGAVDKKEGADVTYTDCFGNVYPAYAKEQAAEYVNMMKSVGPIILDSGDRTEFPSGAVRDMRAGKGRCDLLPLDVVAEYIKLRKNDVDYPVILHINAFNESNDLEHLYAVLDYFVCRYYDGETYTMLLEVAKHFEEGAKKYGDNNWRKGIPVNCYIDSAVRHYLKYLRGDQDEPHDRAFCWNILCCIWTVNHIGDEKEDA